MLELCTLDEIQSHPSMGNLKAQDLAWVSLLMREFSAFAETYTGRYMKVGSHTEYFSPRADQGVLQLRGFGAAAGVTITSVHESLASEWSSTTLVDATEYEVDDQTGKLWRLLGTWWEGNRTVRVVYTGGLATATADVPDDLRMAAIKQVISAYKRRDDIGLQSKSADSQSVTIFDTDLIIKPVKTVLDYYRV